MAKITVRKPRRRAHPKPPYPPPYVTLKKVNPQQGLLGNYIGSAAHDSTVEHVVGLLRKRDYPSTMAVADALGWDCVDSDVHAQTTFLMTQVALEQVADFGSNGWRLRPAPPSVEVAS